MHNRYWNTMRAAAFLMVLLALALTSMLAAAEAARNPQSPWGADYFPNIPLRTQDGKPVRFFDDLIKDKVVAINFIFTSCTDSCPLETARLKEVEQLLGDRIGQDVFLYSISIDPEVDTPPVLKQYAARFGADRPGWLFLTGKKEDINLLRERLGLYMPAIEGSSKDHNLSLIVGNQRTGRWQKASPFENPYVLANQLGSVLHNWKTASVNRNDYANAPTKLREMSKGEQLFRTRCSSCHTLGAEAGALAGPHNVGPDLQGVTQRRERAWLVRWLKHPDKMIAEKDPIALALLEQYKVAMPNLRLNDVEVAALLNYLDDENIRLASAKEPGASHGANHGTAHGEHHGAHKH